MVVAFVLGFGLSLLGSVPMTGPLALLVLDRIISAQRASAFWIALSGAAVEAVLAAAVATFLPLLLPHSESVVRVARGSGALVILGVGLTLALKPSLLEKIKTERKNHSLLAGFLTTALNPTLLATWTVTVTALHTSGALSGGYAAGLAFGAGVFGGALAWFVLILLLSRSFRLAELTRYRHRLGRGVGVFLALLGAVLLVRTAA